MPPAARSQPSPGATACPPPPQRACLLDQAFAAAIAIELPASRNAALRAVAALLKHAGSPAASSTRLPAAASVLNKAAMAQHDRLSAPADHRVVALTSIATAQLALGLKDDAMTTLAALPQLARSSAGYSGANALRFLGAA